MSFNGDPLGFYGKRIIEEHHTALLKNLPPFKPDTDVSNPFDISDKLLRFLPQLKVGILGAGVGGLYTALILDSLNIEYEIIEASDRAGGRLSTYKFPNGGKYDYYVRSFIPPTERFDTDRILYFRKREPCASHFRRRMLLDNSRMGP